MNIPDNFCMAPWVHAMHDTEYVRVACCTSDIPTDAATRHAMKFEEFQNSEHMKSIRRSLMSGVIPYPCRRCDSAAGPLKNVNLYKDFWNSAYGNYYKEAMEQTDADGSTTFQPVQFDYRFGNSCNYKCRHCASHASSSIQLEERLNNLEPAQHFHIVDNPDERNNILYSEMVQAVDQGRLHAVSWVGGEPLFSPKHWEFMEYLHEKKQFSVIIGYITNLSILQFKGRKLADLLQPFDSVSIHASLESGGLAAEYIRRGMTWSKWKESFMTLKQSFALEDPSKKRRHFGPGLTINVLTICGLREWLDFVSETKTITHDITIIKPNDNGICLGFEVMQPELKAQWVDNYRQLVSGYEGQIQDSTYKDLLSAADLIERIPYNEYHGYTPKSIRYLKKLDQIDQYPTINDVIRGWTYLEQWWIRLNEQYAE